LKVTPLGEDWIERQDTHLEQLGSVASDSHDRAGCFHSPFLQILFFASE